MIESDIEDIKEQINSALDLLNRKTALKMLGEILREYDLITASNLVKTDCEPYLHKLMFEDCFYSEGREDTGFIKLTNILNIVEEVVNLDDYMSEKIKFEYFVRPETDEEIEENGHSTGVEWWTKDEDVSLNDLYIQFQGN